MALAYNKRCLCQVWACLPFSCKRSWLTIHLSDARCTLDRQTTPFSVSYTHQSATQACHF